MVGALAKAGWWESELAGRHSAPTHDDDEEEEEEDAPLSRETAEAPERHLNGGGATELPFQAPAEHWRRTDNGTANTRQIQDAVVGALVLRPGDVVLEVGFAQGETALKVAGVLAAEAHKCDLEEVAAARLAAAQAHAEEALARLEAMQAQAAVARQAAMNSAAAADAKADAMAAAEAAEAARFQQLTMRQFMKEQRGKEKVAARTAKANRSQAAETAKRLDTAERALQALAPKVKATRAAADRAAKLVLSAVGLQQLERAKAQAAQTLQTWEQGVAQHAELEAEVRWYA
jgi:hypothetical protein